MSLGTKKSLFNVWYVVIITYDDRGSEDEIGYSMQRRDLRLLTPGHSNFWACLCHGEYALQRLRCFSSRSLPSIVDCERMSEMSYCIWEVIAQQSSRNNDKSCPTRRSRRRHVGRHCRYHLHGFSSNDKSWDKKEDADISKLTSPCHLPECHPVLSVHVLAVTSLQKMNKTHLTQKWAYQAQPINWCGSRRTSIPGMKSILLMTSHPLVQRLCGI